MRAYNAAHREEKRAYNAAYRAAHREELRAYNAAHREEKRAYYVANRERIIARTKAWRTAHLEERLAYEKARNAARREETRAYNAAYRPAHREKERAYKAAYYAAHREESRAYQASRRKEINEARRIRNLVRWAEDLPFRVLGNLRNRMVKVLKGKIKSAATEALIGCSIPDFLLYLENQFRPGMTWKNYGPVWHIDHIKPCARFDLSNPAQQRECFHFSNQQPLFAEENLRKGAK